VEMLGFTLLVTGGQLVVSLTSPLTVTVTVTEKWLSCATWRVSMTCSDRVPAVGAVAWRIFFRTLDSPCTTFGGICESN